MSGPPQLLPSEDSIEQAFHLDVTGSVNGEPVTVHGSGTIRTEGVYKAKLTTSQLPSGLHPAAISTFATSCGCIAKPSKRNGAANLADANADVYEYTRKITTGGDELVLQGSTTNTDDALEVSLELSGTASFPESMAGHSIYTVQLSPAVGGRLTGVGEGTLYELAGDHFEIRIDSEYRFQDEQIPPELATQQNRIVSENGRYVGDQYFTTVHSHLDRQAPVAVLNDRQSAYAFKD